MSNKRSTVSALTISMAMLTSATTSGTEAAPMPVREEAPLEAESPQDHRVLSMAITGGVFGALYGWNYLAWYLHADNSPSLRFHDEGWFGIRTYAGGADKLGHAWANYAIGRGAAGILEWGGWGQRTSVATATAATFGFFLMTELKDGYTKDYGFSWGDVVANLAGNLFGVAFEAWPALDRAIDLRLEYWPSKPFRRSIASKGPFNSSEDYTGQRFFVAYHLSSLGALRDSHFFGWTQYIDLCLGFHAAHYKPDDTDSAPHTQELFAGLSLNLQRVVENTMMTSARASAGVRALHFATELYQVPYTALKLVQVSRSTPDALTEVPPR